MEHLPFIGPVRAQAIILCLGFFCLTGGAGAAVIVADHFDMPGDIVVASPPVNITSESAGDWNTLSADHEVDVAAAAGHTGRGLLFHWEDSTGMTQGGALSMSGVTATFPYPASVFCGFWFRMNKTGGWGSGSSNLKITRLYAGNMSIIPTWVAGQFNFYHSPSSNVPTGYFVPDTDWHRYVFEVRGASTPDGTDGIKRLWIDGELRYQSTAVNWNGTERDIIRFGDGSIGTPSAVVQGNLSGDYNGGVFISMFDDYILATTKAEVEAFLGITVPDTTPPAVPEGLRVQ